jgi:hypothetical protein
MEPVATKGHQRGFHSIPILDSNIGLRHTMQVQKLILAKGLERDVVYLC